MILNFSRFFSREPLTLRFKGFEHRNEKRQLSCRQKQDEHHMSKRIYFSPHRRWRHLLHIVPSDTQQMARTF